MLMLPCRQPARIDSRSGRRREAGSSLFVPTVPRLGGTELADDTKGRREDEDGRRRHQGGDQPRLKVLLSSHGDETIRREPIVKFGFDRSKRPLQSQAEPHRRSVPLWLQANAR
ncbi:MAG: hypothetical protein DWQ53_09800 [Microcystis flos-aquae DF17]|nr:MAG: hypothetical protein DWQ53_09800 [Microcystis flos-aquae DF17]